MPRQTRIFFRKGSGQTRTERLLAVLLDGQWHSTTELVRRVGHTFPVAKYVLIHVDGHEIERRRHPERRFEHQYRLVPPRHG